MSLQSHGEVSLWNVGFGYLRRETARPRIRLRLSSPSSGMAGKVVWSGGKSPAEIQQEHNAVSFGVAYGYDLRDHEVTGNVTVVRQCEPSLICFLSWILIVENL